MTEMLVLPLRKFSPDMKSLLLRSLHQICSVLHSVDFTLGTPAKISEISPVPQPASKNVFPSR